ncbi:MAG: hypothetical protein ABEL76_00515, partial [Bradymonadaceae bacterium]
MRSGVSVVAAALVLLAASGTKAYSPKQGAIRRGMVTGVTVDIDGARETEPGEQVARIGVQDCRELDKGDRIVFTFDLNQRFRGSS